MRKSLLVALALSISSFAYAQASTSVLSLMDGPPKAESELTADSFVPFEVEKLAHAKVWCFDYDWHRKHGVDIPADGLNNAEFAHKILDAYAWQNHSPTDSPDAFTGEQRTFYADYYGGYGMGSNLGSGRAAGAGLLQAKGIKSPLAKDKDPFHSSGAVQSIEAIDEALWSQILESETKFGANRVVAVILTGTDGVLKDSNRVFPRALIIREMGLRPAHYMLNSFNPDHLQDSRRVKKALSSLLKDLPYPPSGRPVSDTEALRTGFFELIDREATVLADYYARRLYFGSVSPSNLEITGRRLDLGDHTSQLGYSKIHRLALGYDSPFGETEEFVSMFTDFQQSLAKTLPSKLRTALPNRDEIATRFDSSYTRQRKVEMVRLTGAPSELIDKMQSSPSLLALGQTLVELSKAGNTEPIYVNPAGWPNTSLYDVGDILNKLARVDATNAEAERALAEVINDNPLLKKQLVEQYVYFRDELERNATAEGLKPFALRTFIVEASALRNRNRPGLIRGDRRWHELWDLNDRAIHENPNVVQNYIEEQSRLNIFSFKDANPYELVLEESKDPIQGSALRKVFDARTNRHELVLRIDVSSGSGTFKNQKIAARDLIRMQLQFTDSSGKIQTVKAKRSADKIEFHLGAGLGLNPNVAVVQNLKVKERPKVLRSSSPFADRLLNTRPKSKNCAVVFVNY